MIRKDLQDVVYKTEGEKFDAVVDEIKERHATGQPILVGTISIETSEMLAAQLKKRGIRHNVLNAKQHEREAEIVAQAGPQGRRHDLDQHGRPRHRHRARRQPRDPRAREVRRRPATTPSTRRRSREFEAQCARRARAGGRGAAGSTSSAPSATRAAASTTSCAAAPAARATRARPSSSSRSKTTCCASSAPTASSSWMERARLEEGEAIEHRLITRAIENAQKKVEARNFDIRKHLLDYDDVMNKQRQAFYGRRREAWRARTCTTRCST